MAGDELRTGPPGACLSRAAVGMVIVAGLILPAMALRLPPEGAATETHRRALSPQSCTTECQSDQTDCILDCDGNVKCEAGCTDVGRACVDRCRSSAADAGARS